MPVSIDEFKSKPSGTMTVAEMVRFATFWFPRIVVIVIKSPTKAVLANTGATKAVLP